MTELTIPARPVRPRHAETAAAGNRPIIRFQGITKRFGANVVAVDAVSLDIAHNEFFALLGPSGCGKTTLLRMLAGFEMPTEGTVVLDGQDVTRIPPNRRPVNMVFQSYAVFPHMTVGENVAYGLKVTGVPRAEIGPRVKAALDMVQLGPLIDRRPDQMSGGQRQRVALARALVKRPKVLLLDEPLSALDKKLREEMQLELVRLRHEIGITFIIVTHDQEEAMSMASRMGVMEAGRIVQIGSPTAIYEHPRNRFVADFIGSINLFEGRIAAVEGAAVRLAVPEAGGDLVVREESLRVEPPPAPGATAWIGVRPEKLTVAAAPVEGARPNAANLLYGAVLEVAYLGERSIFHLRLDSGRMIKATMPNERRFGGAGPASGDRVQVSWAPESGILLTV